jgi:glycosyltransferase involved in cell wall biosynthesis
MRVAFVTLRADPDDAPPASRRFRRLAEHLSERGHDVTILCSQWWGGDVDAFDYEDVTYRRVCAQAAEGRFARRLPLSLRKVDPEVIHVRSEPPLAVATARTAGLVLRTPVIADWWTGPGSSLGRFERTQYDLAARLPELVTVPSETCRTSVREHGAARDQIRVVPESIDFSLVEDAPVDRRADIVYARDLDADANVESFLLALAELRHTDWRAAVIGDGPAREDAEAMAADLRIDDRVDFLGDLPHDERVPILKGAHVFAQTASREAFATDLLWALACGCVALVEYQADSCAHELVEGRARHSLVTDPQELAAGIVAAAETDRRTIDAEFAEYDHRDVLERYLVCYRDVMGRYGLL